MRNYNFSPLLQLCQLWIRRWEICIRGHSFSWDRNDCCTPLVDNSRIPFSQWLERCMRLWQRTHITGYQTRRKSNRMQIVTLWWKNTVIGKGLFFPQSFCSTVLMTREIHRTDGLIRYQPSEIHESNERNPSPKKNQSLCWAHWEFHSLLSQLTKMQQLITSVWSNQCRLAIPLIWSWNLDLRNNSVTE